MDAQTNIKMDAQTNTSIDRSTFEKGIAYLSTFFSESNPRKQDLTRWLRRLTYSEDTNHADYIAHALSLDKIEAEAYIDSIIPPAGAIYHDETPCPIVFRQRREIFIDKITTDISEATADPMFWWQPVDVIKIISATQELINVIKTYDPLVDNFSLGQLRSALPAK